MIKELENKTPPEEPQPFSVGDLPPSTAPQQYPICLRGFESEDAAHRFGELLRNTIHILSSFIDLERLDAVTVAYDYNVALAELDRGVQTTEALKATSESFAVGVAMTPVVIRDGNLKSHIVLNAAFVRGLTNANNELNLTVLNLLAHECGHVHDLKIRDNAFPKTLLSRRYSDIRDQLLTKIVNACWEEYTACRLSANFSSEENLDLLVQVFVDSAKEARERADSHIRQYWSDRDLGKVATSVAGEYSNVLKFAAYLLGHLHGLGLQLENNQSVTDFLSSHWSKEYVERLATALADLTTRYGSWKTIEEFEVISEIADDLLWESGLVMKYLPSGDVHVHIFDRLDNPDA